MSKKDFFVLVIKLFGLLSVITSIFSSVPSTISLVLMDFDPSTIFWIVVAVSSLLALLVVLIFKADKVVAALRLDKGFEDNRIELGNFKATDVIRIGTFVIGGLLLLKNIPAFLSHSLIALKAKNLGFQYEMNEKFNWLMSAINLIIGYLLITNYDFVAKKMKGKSDEQDGMI